VAIVRLTGGLGNQMFQYAFGLSLKDRCQFDVSYFFDDPGYRKLELQNFNITGRILSVEEVQLHPRSGKIGKLLDAVLPYYKKAIVHEKKYGFDERLFKVSENSQVLGYFQSEKYFSKVAGKVREQFTLKSELDEANLELYNQIRSTEAVSIHVRRGDYIGNPLFPIYGRDYYFKAIEMIRASVKDPAYYIFSSDLDWCRENLSEVDECRFVDINDESRAYFDLFLMSQCRHNIIANSSLSWWAAWLNAHPGKIVITPPKWVNSIEQFFLNEDILPQRWLKINDLGS
jgi:hypothetical protein